MMHGIGAAFAAAAAMRKSAMCCPECHVEWKGPNDPCWVCGRAGLPKYPDPKPADAVRQYVGERGE